MVRICGGGVFSRGTLVAERRVWRAKGDRMDVEQIRKWRLDCWGVSVGWETGWFVVSLWPFVVSSIRDFKQVSRPVERVSSPICFKYEGRCSGLQNRLR